MLSLAIPGGGCRVLLEPSFACLLLAIIDIIVLRNMPVRILTRNIPYILCTQVPAGVWKIYNTKTACCNTNFAYSNVCDAAPRSEPPTKHPTIARPDDDVYEVIPIKFDVMGLPDDVKMRDVKDEMMTVLKRILLRLADRISGLKVSSVEEKVVLSRKLEKMLRRALEQSVSLYYNVYVVRDDKKKFGPLIIQEIRDSYDEVMEQIQ